MNAFVPERAKGGKGEPLPNSCFLRGKKKEKREGRGGGCSPWRPRQKQGIIAHALGFEEGRKKNVRVLIDRLHHQLCTGKLRLVSVVFSWKGEEKKKEEEILPAMTTTTDKKGESGSLLHLMVHSVLGKKRERQRSDASERLAEKTGGCYYANSSRRKRKEEKEKGHGISLTNGRARGKKRVERI